MSHRIKDEIFNLDLSPNELWVLTAFAEFANDEGKNVYPAKDRIAWMTKLSEKTVRRARDALKARKILIQVARATWVTSENGSRWQRPPEYRIDLSAAPRKPPYRVVTATTHKKKRVVADTTHFDERVVNLSKMGGHPDQERVVNLSKMGGQALTTYPNTEPPKKEKPAREPARARESRDIDIDPSLAREDIPAASDSESSLNEDQKQVFRKGCDDVSPKVSLITNQDVIQQREAKKRALQDQKQKLELKINLAEGVSQVPSPAGKYHHAK